MGVLGLGLKKYVFVNPKSAFICFVYWPDKAIRSWIGGCGEGGGNLTELASQLMNGKLAN